MVKLIGGERVSTLSFILLYIIILLTGGATVFARGFGDITHISTWIVLILSATTMYKQRISINKKFCVAVIVFLIYAVATTINNMVFSPLWVSKWLIFLFVSYIVCQDLQHKLFPIIETIILQLSIISLFFWAIQVISPDTIYWIVKTFEFSQPFSEEADLVGNIIVFTLTSNFNYFNDFFLISRNSGFAWEPGAMASFLTVAIFCNIIRTRATIKGNWSLAILLITLFSTQSTTGIVTVGIMVFLWLLVNKKYLYTILLIPIMLYVFNLPFVGDKLIEEYIAIEDLNLDTMHDEMELSRMQSLTVAWDEFKRHPILGLGGNMGGSWLQQHGYDVAIFSGIGELLARYGIIMSILFVCLLSRSILCINRLFRTKNGYLLYVVMIGTMFSFGIWSQPFFIVLWLYGVLSPCSNKRIDNIMVN